MNDLKQKALELAQRPYTVIIFRDKVDEDEYVYMAINPELEGCMAQAETSEEAQEILEDVRIDYMEHFLKYNLPIPTPQFLNSQTGSESLIEEQINIVRSIDNILNDIIQPVDREKIVEALFIAL